MFEGHVRSLKGGFQTYIESLTSFLFVNPISLVELSPGQFWCLPQEIFKLFEKSKLMIYTSLLIIIFLLNPSWNLNKEKNYQNWMFWKQKEHFMQHKKHSLSFWKRYF